MNLIPWNSNAGFGYRRPDPEKTAAMATALYRRGILTKLRNSAGQDVDGGCGQLRARSEIRRRPAPGVTR
jgi:23S rRNA (adenine2503-C2)-methyltransferase